MISINPDDIMKNYATFQNILAKTKKDGEVVISKEDVLQVGKTVIIRIFFQIKKLLSL